MISIKSCLDSYAAQLERQWKHDRSQTVGASEVGQCVRKTWFVKNDAPRDPEYVDGWGAKLRGTIIENAFWEPALRATLPEGVRLLFAGEDQQTIVDGYLSATTDGLLVGVSRDALAWMGIPDIGSDCINLDCKTIDPRAGLPQTKAEHAFQVQAQKGLVRYATEWRPYYSIVSYINASFWDDVKEFAVKFDPRIYAAAKARAETIMTSTDPLELSPEGKISGGKECEYCAWASHCAAVTVAGMPGYERAPLDEETVAALRGLREEERAARETIDIAREAHAVAQEEIKDFLRAHNTRGYRGTDWSVSWSSVNGKATLDKAAIEAAGIDLAPYYKPGKPSERLTVT